MTPSLPQVGEEFAGYRLRQVLGRGGMSVVFEAENPRLGTTIALKVLAPELSDDDVFRARFLKESRIAASLNHPHVIPIYDTGPAEGLLYIAMRYVAGLDLRTVLKAQGHISPDQALLVVGETGRALDAAHRHGLVHRDVKPANVLIEKGEYDEPDHVYLADFGITKHTLSESGLTATGQFVGTIDYIAPEQIQDRPVDGRTDLYSLGCVLYECLCGRVPFVKEVDAAVIWAHVQEMPPAPSSVRPELPDAIDEVIARALAKEPDDRYSTCREMVESAHTALKPILQTGAAAGSGRATTPPTVLSAPPAGQAQPTASATHEPAAPTAAAGDAAGVGGGHGAPVTPTAEPTGASVGGGSHGSAHPPPGDGGAPADRPSGPTGRSRPRRGQILALAAVVLVVAGVIVWLTTSGGSKGVAPGEPRAAALAAVPDNHVQGVGSATLRLNGDSASVTVTSSGLLDGSPHLMHIHAGGTGSCPPASAAKLHNGHLAISTDDGIPYYGPPEASLTTSGDASAASYLAFNRFPRTGNINYTRTITVSSKLAQKIRGNLAVVVIHGIDYDGSGIYDNVLSHSELLPSVPADATAPALCGSLVAVKSSAVPSGAHAPRPRVYVAALTVDTNPLEWWCEAGGVLPSAPARREV